MIATNDLVISSINQTGREESNDFISRFATFGKSLQKITAVFVVSGITIQRLVVEEYSLFAHIFEEVDSWNLFEIISVQRTA